jgi:hypothetical protein
MRLLFDKKAILLFFYQLEIISKELYNERYNTRY